MERYLVAFMVIVYYTNEQYERYLVSFYVVRYNASVQDNTILRLVSEQETLWDNTPSYIIQYPALFIIIISAFKHEYIKTRKYFNVLHSFTNYNNI